MVRLPFRRHVGLVNEGLMNRIGRELDERMSTTEDSGYRFIHPEEVKKILTRERVKELLDKFEWYKEDDRTALWQQMRLIMCVLIWMRLEDWNQFNNYFFVSRPGFYPRYRDTDLPIQPDQWPPNVSSTFSASFFTHQYVFVPIIIAENSHLQYSINFRLPILKVEALEGMEGAQGIVQKVHVERLFLKSLDEDANQNVSRSF